MTSRLVEVDRDVVSQIEGEVRDVLTARHDGTHIRVGLMVQVVEPGSVVLVHHDSCVDRLKVTGRHL